MIRLAVLFVANVLLGLFAFEVIAVELELTLFELVELEDSRIARVAFLPASVAFVYLSIVKLLERFLNAVEPLDAAGHPEAGPHHRSQLQPVPVRVMHGARPTESALGYLAANTPEFEADAA